MCDDFLLGRDTSMIEYEDIHKFFMETICNENNNFVNLNSQGYNCI